MKAPEPPENEEQRIAALRQLRILDTPAEERFDRITRTARDLFQVPIALVSLVDTERQWFKSKVGLDARETPRSVSFCGHAILQAELLVVEDATQDERFADNPLVTGPPDIRFYAGMPVKSTTGECLGSLCVIDRQPRKFSADDERRLRDLAAWVERELNMGVDIEHAIADMRETFVRLVSHELRTPMTGVVGALNLMNSGMVKGDDFNELTRIASEGAGRLTRLVDNIVEIAELDASQREVPLVRIELDLFLEAASDSLRDDARERNIAIEQNVPEGLRVMASQQPLVRIMRTLLDNAISFSPTDTIIAISAELGPEGMVRIRVVDQGPGIPDDYLPKLFLPFAQVDASDSRHRDGCGVSLAISRRLAISMGGRLGYEGTKEGGSCFFLDLPAS